MLLASLRLYMTVKAGQYDVADDHEALMRKELTHLPALPSTGQARGTRTNASDLDDESGTCSNRQQGGRPEQAASTSMKLLHDLKSCKFVLWIFDESSLNRPCFCCPAFLVVAGLALLR